MDRHHGGRGRGIRWIEKQRFRVDVSEARSSAGGQDGESGEWRRERGRKHFACDAGFAQAELKRRRSGCHSDGVARAHGSREGLLERGNLLAQDELSTFEEAIEVAAPIGLSSGDSGLNRVHPKSTR